MAKIAGKLSSLVLIIIFVALLNNNTSGTPPVTTKTLTVARADLPVNALLYVAEAQGYFEEERLKVNFQTHDTGSSALNSVVEDKADIASAYETPFINTIMRGQDVKAIATLHSSNRGTVLVAQKGKGITKPTDIRGKRIGLVAGTNAEYFLHSLIVSTGTPKSEVVIVNVGREDLVNLLKDPTIDAVVAWNYQIEDLKKSYPDKLEFIYSDTYREVSLLVGKEQSLVEKSDELERFLRAVKKASEFTINNRESTIQIVENRLGESSGQFLANSWEDIHFDVAMTNLVLTIINTEAQWMRETNVFTSPPSSFDPYLYTDILGKVDPHSVTIINE